MVCAQSPTVAIWPWIRCEIQDFERYNAGPVKFTSGKKCTLPTVWAEQLEIRQLAFANWSSIGPAIALVPQSAGQLSSVSVVNFGTTVYTGPLNVANTLNRIRADDGPDRSDDGIVYNDPQGSGLPVDGTYYEFTVEPTDGTDQDFSSITFPGPMRILLATGGDCYFTGDHYTTFEPVYIAGTVSQPTIGSFTVSPTTVTAGTEVTLTASNVSETGGTISSVSFYLGSNGTPGLQIGSDTFVSTGVHSGTSWIVGDYTTGFAAGTYTYYAVATDTNNISSVASSASVVVSATVTANVLADWDVNGQTNFGTQGLAAAGVATGISNSLGLTRASGVTTSGSGAANAWGGSGWALTSAAGITGNKFVTFGLTVSPDSTASLSAIDMNYRHSSTGPASGYWQYQINSGAWNLIGDFPSEFPNTSTSPMAEIDLSGFASLQNLTAGTSVNFQIVPYGASGSGGTWYVGDESGSDLTIKGFVVAGSPLLLTGPANYLKLDADGQHVDVWNSTNDSGNASQSILLSQISSMSYVGSAADDSLTVDFSAGDPLIAAGLSFDGGTGGQNDLNIIGDAGNDSVSVGSSTVLFGSIPITYADTTAITFSGGSGSDLLTQTAQPGGGASLAFAGTTAADALAVNAGTFTFPAAPVNSGITADVLGTLSIGAGAMVAVAEPVDQPDRSVLVLNTLSIATSSGAWEGQLDLSGNDMIVQNGILATVTGQISSGYNGGNWIGKGIISSTAADDPTNLTTLGVIANTAGRGAFDRQNPPVGSILVKYTYFGDANLDGVVNGSDYTCIDNGFNAQLSGWANGDFDYSNSINASDYLLIDNAFDMGAVSMAVVSATAPTEKTAVKPTAMPLAINSFNDAPLPGFADFDADDLRDKARLNFIF
jgi:guanyl-specific ribonuclease Sa